MQEINYFPIALSGELPDVTNDTQLNSLRRVLGFLKTYGLPEVIAQETLGRLAQITDQRGESIFSDQRETAPSVILAKNLAYIGALSDFKAANVPLLIEDYILSLRGERPIQGLPEFVWIVYRMEEPLLEDYTIPPGRVVTDSDNKKRYKAVYPLTIPAGAFGNEVSNETSEYVYQQLYRATSTGTGNRVAPRALKRMENSLPYVKEFWNPETSFGGRNPERFGDYRVRAFQMPEDTLLVSPDDYVNDTKIFLGPGSRAIVVGNDDYEDSGSINRVKISGIDPNGNVINDGNGGIALIEYLKTKDPNSEVKIFPPVFTDIEIDLDIVFESQARVEGVYGFGDPLLNGSSIDLTVRTIINELVRPSNWADWGEYENTFTNDKVTDAIKTALPSEVDSVRISRLSYIDEFRIPRVHEGYVPPVQLRSIIGLPRVTVRNIFWRKEFGS